MFWPLSGGVSALFYFVLQAGGSASFSAAQRGRGLWETHQSCLECSVDYNYSSHCFAFSRHRQSHQCYWWHWCILHLYFPRLECKNYLNYLLPRLEKCGWISSVMRYNITLKRKSVILLMLRYNYFKRINDDDKWVCWVHKGNLCVVQSKKKAQQNTDLYWYSPEITRGRTL